MSITFLPMLPGWIVAAVAVALVALLAHGSTVLLSKRVPGRWIAYLDILRVVAIVLFILYLLRPVISFTRNVDQKPDLLVMLDTSKSMSVASEGDRSRLARTLDDMERNGMADALRERYNLKYFAFDDNAHPLDEADLDSVPIDGEGTNLAESLTTAWGFYRQQSPSEGGAQVLIVSDGIDRGVDDAAQVARQFGLSVSTLAPPTDQAARSDPAVIIASTQSPRRVLLGSESRFRVTLQHEQAAGMPLSLELLEDGQPVVKHDFTFGADEAERTINLTHRPSQPGSKRYTMRVTATDEGAALREPAPYEVTVNVIGRTKNVLVLEDTFRWEFKYLRRVLEDDPSFAMTAFLGRGSGIYMQYAEPDRTVKLGGFPQSRAELEWFDVLILGDVKPVRWPPQLAAAINELVVEDGKSLVVIAGPNLAQWESFPLLSRLLPVEIDTLTARPTPGPLAVIPSRDGTTASLFYTPPGADEGVGIDWSRVPAMDQLYVPSHKKPAATILLESPDHTNDFGQAIVMAEHTVGKGRVLYIGTDTLWRWQMLGLADAEGNTPYQIFWQQALRSLAPTQMTEGQMRFSLLTDRSKYGAGQTVRVRAEIDALARVDNPTIEGRVALPDGRELPLVISPDSETSGTYRARLEAAQPGHYRISANVVVDGKTAADVTTSIDVDPPADEMSRLAIDHDTLTRIASATGGKAVDAADADTWPAPASDEPVTVSKATTWNLWNNYTLMLMLVGVLGFDWLVRLLRGFV